MKGVGSISRAMLRGGLRRRGGTGSESEEEAAAKRGESSVGCGREVRGVVIGEGRMGALGENAVERARTLVKAVSWIFMVDLRLDFLDFWML